MRNLFRAATLLALVAAVASCNLLKKKGAADAGAEEAGAVTEAVDAAPAEPPAPLAANVDDIARFPDEVKLENAAASTLRTASAREAPAIGKVVAQLKTGTAVTKIAQRDKFFLVTFDDPKDATKKLLGWLHQDSFSPPSAAPLKAITCPAPEVALLGDTPFCGQTCTADAQCPAGKACKGSAQQFTAGKVGANVQVCTVFVSADAGAPKPVDAGGPVAVVDAGPPKPVDAGAPALTAANSDIFDPGAAACPGGFIMVLKDKRCHRSCPTGLAPKDCTHGSPFCGKCDGAKVCTAVRDFCK
jgi:hypothetical protein